MEEYEDGTAASPPATPAPPSGNPWEQRATLGFLAAFFENIKLFVTSPRQAWSQTRDSGDVGSPLIFAICLGWLMAIVASLWNLLLGGAWYNMMPDEFQQFAGSMAAGSAFGFVVNVIVAPFVVVIGVFIMSVVLHISGLLVGATKASEAGFEGSLRVVSYTMVAQLGQLIPVAGGLITLVWGVVLAVLGVSALHRTTEGKATAAVLLPLILCCVCMALFALFGFAVVGASLFNAFGS